MTLLQQRRDKVKVMTYSSSLLKKWFIHSKNMIQRIYLVRLTYNCSYNLGHMLVEICEIWQNNVLVRELAKSAYFRCASSESDNK